MQKVNDNLSASTAQSDAETILANNPDVNGLYGVYSYDGPALAQAVQSAKKIGQVSIVSDDSDAQTLAFINSGVIGGTVVQMPYQQGYTGAYILAAEKVLGKAATHGHPQAVPRLGRLHALLRRWPGHQVRHGRLHRP